MYDVCVILTEALRSPVSAPISDQSGVSPTQAESTALLHLDLCCRGVFHHACMGMQHAPQAGVNFLQYLVHCFDTPEQLQSMLNIADSDTQSCLAIAAGLGHAQAVEFLLGLGISTKDHLPNQTALVKAAAGGYHAIVQLLLLHDFEPDGIEASTVRPQVHIGENTTSSEHSAAFAFILQHGPESSATTPLIAAICGGHATVVKVLLVAGASVNLCDAAGRSPLQAAVWLSNSEMVETLLLAGSSWVHCERDIIQLYAGQASAPADLEALLRILPLDLAKRVTLANSYDFRPIVPSNEKLVPLYVLSNCAIEDLVRYIQQICAGSRILKMNNLSPYANINKQSAEQHTCETLLSVYAEWLNDSRWHDDAPQMPVRPLTEASVVDTAEVKVDGKSTTTYIIECHRDGRAWSIAKRYSEFDRLRQDLIAIDTVGADVEFPSKAIWVDVKQRQASLNAWFQRMVTNDEPSDEPAPREPVEPLASDVASNTEGSLHLIIITQRSPTAILVTWAPLSETAATSLPVYELAVKYDQFWKRESNKTIKTDSCFSLVDDLVPGSIKVTIRLMDENFTDSPHVEAAYVIPKAASDTYRLHEAVIQADPLQVKLSSQTNHHILLNFVSEEDPNTPKSTSADALQDTGTHRSLDVAAVDRVGEEMILHAWCKGEIHLVKNLIGQGVDVNQVEDMDGRSLLWLATQDGNSQMVDWLLQNKRADVFHKNGDDGGTALHCACLTVSERSCSIAAIICNSTSSQHDSDDQLLVNITDQQGRTPLLCLMNAMTRAKDSDSSVALPLARTLVHTPAANLDACDLAGENPVLLACRQRSHFRADFVSDLLTAGASVNGVSDLRGRSPLHIACESETQSFVEGIFQDLLGDRAARHQGQTDMITAVLDAGADIDARDANGRSPLLCLCQSSTALNVAAIDLLLSRGADPALRDSSGKTPVCFAFQDSAEQGEKLLRVLSETADFFPSEICYSNTIFEVGKSTVELSPSVLTSVFGTTRAMIFSLSSTEHLYDASDRVMWDGIALDSATGSITGVPTKVGERRLTIIARDKQYPWFITAQSDIKIIITPVKFEYLGSDGHKLHQFQRCSLAPTLPDSFSQDCPFEFRCRSPLPAGLTLSPQTGEITGTPEVTTSPVPNAFYDNVSA
jgi:ankyrin repeat protein